MKIDKDRIKRVVPRLLYEGKGKLYYLNYLLRKVSGPKEMNKKIEKLLGVSPKEFVQKNMKQIFITDKDADPFRKIRKNEEVYHDIIRAAEHTVNDRFYILHKYHDNVRDRNGHYQWNKDIFSGYVYFVRYKADYSKRVLDKSKGDRQDLKGPWELSRLQYIVAPALAWRLTGEKKYADKVINILADWIHVNVLDEGPNWNCAMENGIRAVNMLLAFQLIKDYEGITDEFCFLFIFGIYEHLYSVLWNLENYAGRTYNHYLGDIIGILAITASCPFFEKAKVLYRQYKGEFEREIRRQILPDGGNFEGSTCYHGLVGEMFALAALIVENHGETFSKSYYDRLYRMLAFSSSLAKLGSEEQPQIGDNDSGRVIEILPHPPLDYAWFINMSSMLTERCYRDTYYGDILSFMLGTSDTVKKETGKEKIFFPDFGIGGYRNEEIYVLLSATESQRHGLGGHTHNDKLSVELNYKGKDFITDPGSGVYTSDEKLHIRMRSVFSHSTVIVNGWEQNTGQTEGFFGNSYEAKCKINTPIQDSAGCMLCGMLQVENAAYSYTHIRRMRIKEHTIILSDEIEGENLSEVRINFVIAPYTKLEIDGNRVYLKKDGAEIKMTAVSKWEREEGVFSPSYGRTELCDILFVRVKANNNHVKAVTKMILE